MIERGLLMLLHSAIIGVVLYAIMVQLLGQKSEMAEDRSILIAAVVLIYMIVFGHSLPGTINKNIM
jgi:high-affinity Fe2+/Pb2+ permease